jgi:chemotaxis protein MotB
MKKRPQPHGNHERWILSYADFMTLLFAFFVVLYSSAEVDKAKMASLSNAIAAGFQDLGVGAGQGAAPIVIPGTNPAAFTHPARPQPASDIILRKLEADLAPELQNHTVSLRQTPEGLVLSLHELGFFDSGSSDLRASSLSTFDRIGSVIASVGSNLRIEGHTDNIPISTARFHSNWELSTARAAEIIRIFITREHINPERLSAAGYAEYHPVADNSTEDGRRLNRRVDIVIITARQPQTAPPAPVPNAAKQ